jgi:hypothetical protein
MSTENIDLDYYKGQLREGLERMMLIGTADEIFVLCYFLELQVRKAIFLREMTQRGLDATALAAEREEIVVKYEEFFNEQAAKLERWYVDSMRACLNKH